MSHFLSCFKKFIFILETHHMCFHELVFIVSIYIHLTFGSALGVIVIIMGNGHGDMSSNPRKT